jgi:predicted Ser/Thr protein kinase
LNQGITAFEAQKGRKPTAQEVEKLRQLTEKKMILSGIK